MEAAPEAIAARSHNNNFRVVGYDTRAVDMDVDIDICIDKHVAVAAMIRVALQPYCVVSIHTLAVSLRCATRPHRSDAQPRCLRARKVTRQRVELLQMCTSRPRRRRPLTTALIRDQDWGVRLDRRHTERSA